jgi:lysophospholipase
MTHAPFYAEHAEAPADGKACWIKASDGVRLRLVFWSKGSKGTVLIFPGRTEFAEKYGRVAARLQALDYGVAVIDWRGQGLSDRLAPNRKLGHVGEFGDYQLDVAAMMDEIATLNMPEPYFLCSHSMGGAIALRALQNGLAVRRAVFTAPMWGLTIDPLWRPLVQAISAGSKTVGLGAEFAPGTSPKNYLNVHEFDDNVLTSSEDTWNYLVRLTKAHTGLEIGGPSIQWLYEALTETKQLSSMPPPDYEMLCLIGSNEKVVDRRDVLEYAAKWDGAQVMVVTGARHEILMETPKMQPRALRLIDWFYSGEAPQEGA